MATLAALVPSSTIKSLNTSLHQKEIDKLIDRGNKPQEYAAIFEVMEQVMYGLKVDSQNMGIFHYEYIRTLTRDQLREYANQISQYLEDNEGWRWKNIRSRKTYHWRRAISCVQYARNRSKIVPR